MQGWHYLDTESPKVPVGHETTQTPSFKNVFYEQAIHEVGPEQVSQSFSQGKQTPGDARLYPLWQPGLQIES